MIAYLKAFIPVAIAMVFLATTANSHMATLTLTLLACLLILGESMFYRFIIPLCAAGAFCLTLIMPDVPDWVKVTLTVLATIAFSLIALLSEGWYRSAMDWRRMYQEMKAYHEGFVAAWIETNRQAYTESVGKFLDDFFDGTPITNHIMTYSKGGQFLRIGDDDLMIAVDIEAFRCDPVAALERAKMTWMERKAAMNDLGTQGG